jgi:IS30 family transposase
VRGTFARHAFKRRHRFSFTFVVRQTCWVKYHQLSTLERYEIAAMRRQPIGVTAMAKHLGRHRSTLYREVKRNQSVHDGHYRPTHAVEKASGRKHRSRRNWFYGPMEFRPIETLIRQRLAAALSPSRHHSKISVHSNSFLLKAFLFWLLGSAQRHHHGQRSAHCFF